MRAGLDRDSREPRRHFSKGRGYPLRRRHLLDPLRAGSYIAACVAVVACRGRPAPLIPEPLAPIPAESVPAWVGRNGPPRATALRFRWRYRDNRRSGGGRGTARVAPPDSLRVDWAAVLGLKSGAAVVLGDSLQWADPKDNFTSSVPAAVELVWTALGVTRPAREGVTVFGMRDSVRIQWRYVEREDTVDFVLTAAPARTLQAEWRRAARVMARSRTELGPGGLPTSARIDVPERSARFEVTFVGVDTAATFDPALWRSRR
jgi:hypothetical protein